ncbi:MAG: hypothetical protein IJK78_05750 [Bacteroidales bacterium]|nr:hypothetical protein [Bacteroidales bacterium]
MKKLVVIMTIIGLCFVFGLQARAQFSLHAGYSPSVLTEKTNMGESHSAKYQSFYAGGLYSIDAYLLSFSLGAKFQYDKRIGDVDTFVNTNVPNEQFQVGVPILVNVNYNFFYSNGSKTIYIKMFPYFGVMPTYRKDMGEQSGYKAFDVNLMGGLLLGYSHFNLYAGYQGGLLDLDNNEATTSRLRGWFFGVAYSF